MKLTTFAASALLALAAAVSSAAIADQDPAKLGQELTPVGAEQAANADGSIPAWTGGDMKPPAAWKRGQPRPDPYGS